MNDEIEFLWRRAEKVALKFLGLNRIQDAKEIAGDVAVSYLRKQKKGQTVDQAVIDAIRARFGRTGTSGHTIREAYRHAKPDLLETVIGIDTGFERRFISIENVFRKVNQLDRSIFLLARGFELNGTDIGNWLGVTESRISQRLKKVQARIRKNLAREKQGKISQRQSGPLPQQIQNQPENNEGKEGKVEKICTEKGENVAKFTIKKISENLRKSFRVNTF